MPARKKRRRHGKPHKAVIVTTYQRLEEYLRAFAAGHFHLVILVGAGGVGKSRSVRSVLQGKGCWIEGNATPFGMYVKLYVRFVASFRPVMRYAKEAFDMTRCSAIGRLPQRAPLATVGSEAWGTT
jgi:hypothetical protein